MLNVLRSAIQNCCWPSTNEKLSKPTQGPSPAIRSQWCSDTQPVYSRGNRPMTTKRMKNGEI
jgi:hypothetical protein